MRRLRRQYPNELVVIGVHSAKFPAEKLTANIRAAVARHGITHPVVNDAEFQVWTRYGVRAWPTVMVVDPAGKVVGYQPGELDADAFAPVFDGLIAAAAADGTLDRTPLPFLAPADDAADDTFFRFPSKIATAHGGRLFVADTGRHRIVEIQLAEDGLHGEPVRVFGTGQPGLQDGPIAQARFHDPHGMAFRQTPTGSTLYVADTENHAVRAIDLVRETVTTIAGTGRMGRGLRVTSADPRAIDLRSPWALALLDDALFIAMAGSHQIWVRLDDTRMGVFAGTGAEALVDGPRDEAAFNQPSDLVLTMGHLFIADAEASAVRAIGLDEEMRVMTLVGQGLFEFGDVDGQGAAVRLQHPTGLATDGRLLYIADTYNHKIKTLDPSTGDVRTLIGTGAPGADDGPFALATLYEPEGLAYMDGRLYIADTNNHVVRVADLATGVISTLAASGDVV